MPVTYKSLPCLTEEQWDRFWKSVDKTESCWNWIGRTWKGYGLFSANRIEYKATRLILASHTGSDGIGLEACHNCPGGDNPNCVNPEHLFWGTHTDNMRDAAEKGLLGGGHRAKTHCPHGHPYSTTNTQPKHGGGRLCKTCQYAYTVKTREIKYILIKLGLLDSVHKALPNFQKANPML